MWLTRFLLLSRIKEIKELIPHQILKVLSKQEKNNEVQRLGITVPEVSPIISLSNEIKDV